ncbi:HDOD domain-containing protein [Marinobacter halodurans]|uniref:HDOD domain-containing protein n=1 Tax=Marinobacter halodurans TaxID=2528979 RepID=A0ABY1ZSA2_9GAMM|nr:HDOD domain-containing protein [Marinobacter halodurans]TBW57876.1 HDOD domain-containing protein [Marinobacter halodurans]
MPASAKLEMFLNRKGIDYETINHDEMPNFDVAVSSVGVPQQEVVRATLLIDLNGVVMAVHSYQTAIDVEAVSRVTGRRLQLLTARQADRLFADCEPGFHPPVGAPYDVPVVVDTPVLEMAHAYLTSGSNNSLLRLDGRGLRLVLAGARKASISIVDTAHDLEKGHGADITLDDVARRLQKLYRLPPMPALALKILRLTTNPEATARELADLIEYDPSLSAQIMRYARSALFNYPGQINSVQEAVTRVLGFDRVAHVAMGIASVRAFDVPRDGMLGTDAFWRHSLYCAHLCQQMAALKGIDKGLAYLCGLLHNFGLLLVGHLFPMEFEQLNRLREANPDQSMRALEMQVFGGDQEFLTVGHGAIGGILHRLWQLPDAVVKTAGMHQHPEYEGEHADYVHIVQLANGLLKSKDIGDEFNPDDTAALAGSLGFTEADVAMFVAATDDVAQELDELARSLAA